MEYHDYADRYRDKTRYKATHSYDGGYRGGKKDPAPCPKPERRKSKGKVVAAIVLALLAIMTALSVSFCLQIDTRLHDFPSQEQSLLDSTLAPSALLGVQPCNILLLGSDARSDDLDMGARTDAIILARIDPNAKTVSMVSIPRDTMVDIPGYGTSKINAAYAISGPSGAVEAVERLCGIPIDHCAVVDFNGLCQLVDAIGGIDVVVDEAIDNPKAGDATLEAGPQHINGAQALVMSRDRDYADGDYTRQANQRKVISGIAKKILDMPPWQTPDAISGFADCLSTDGGCGCAGIALTMLRMKVPWATMQMKTAVLPSVPADIDGISYVIADKAGTQEMMERLKTGRDIEAPITTSSIDEDIANATA